MGQRSVANDRIVHGLHLGQSNSIQNAIRAMANVNSLDNSCSWEPQSMSGIIYRLQEILKSFPDKLTPVG